MDGVQCLLLNADRKVTRPEKFSGPVFAHVAVAANDDARQRVDVADAMLRSQPPTVADEVPPSLKAGDFAAET